jgi:hypothetical protein
MRVTDTRTVNEKVICRHGPPYGADDPQTQERLLAWAKLYNLKYVPHDKCLCWLKTGRCQSECFDRNDWLDHVTGWIDQETGERVLISQPYDLDRDKVEELMADAEKFNLDFVIQSNGWYGHRTVCIVMRNRKAE